MRIVELLINDITNEEVGIDGIGLVKRPAHEENWLAFNEVTELKQPYETLTPDQMDELAKTLLEVGEDEDTLLEEGWELYKVQELNKQEFVGSLISNPNEPSEEDTPFARIRYKYVGPKDRKNRPFCGLMMSSKKVFRREDISMMSEAQTNQEISKYSGYYDIFEWRGSYNCRHRWVKLFYKPVDETTGIAQARILNNSDRVKGLDGETPVPARDTTTTKAAENGYNALAFTTQDFELIDIIDNTPLFTTKEEAIEVANQIGCTGYHVHNVEGVDFYMPCETHPQKMEDLYDVPQYARDKACKARKYKEENPNVDCGTRVGWLRSAQLCNGDKVSRDIIARMSAFGRHLSNAEKQSSYDEGCALLMVDAWGGKEGIEWASKELERIDKTKLDIDVTSLPPYTSQTGTPVTESVVKPRLQFSYDDEKMEITGAALIPNKLIVRQDAMGQPYYVYFSEDTIKRLSQKWMKEKKLDTNINIEHSSIIAKDTYVIESWIVEDELDDKSNALGLNYPKGSWVITMKTDDPSLWEDIKSGKYQGYSVEGYFEEKQVFTNEEDMVLQQIKNLIKSTND